MIDSQLNASISFAFQAIQKLFTHPLNLCFVVFCTFWGEFGKIWDEIVFLKGLVKLRTIRNIKDLM